jgi:S-formylglutathione hydrolase FrmB
VRRVWTLLVGICACARPAAPQARTLEVDVVAERPARGVLVASWRTPAEQAEVDAGRMDMIHVRAMLERSEPQGEIDFASRPRVHVRVANAPAGAIAVALLDVDHTFWETLVGGGHGLVGSGKANTELRLVANPSRPPPNAERCKGERYRLLTLDAPELSPQPRRFCAWLPKSWEASPARRYPIVLMFPGLMSTDLAYLTGRDHLGVRLDRMDREAVLVGVDTSTAIGSTYLEDSPATGPWATFMTTRALPEIDRELHGLGRRSGRALIGQSTGGFNVLSLGMRRTDLFATIGASSPDPPDFEPWMFEPGSRRARPWVHHWLRLEAAVGGAGQMTSWAAAFSSGRWPFDPITERNDEVVAEWTRHSPHALLPRAKDLRGKIFVTVGRRDEFDLFPASERFVKELEQNGLEPTFLPTDEGHGNQNDRLEKALAFVLDRLDRAE